MNCSMSCLRITCSSDRFSTWMFFRWYTWFSDTLFFGTNSSLLMLDAIDPPISMICSCRCAASIAHLLHRYSVLFTRITKYFACKNGGETREVR